MLVETSDYYAKPVFYYRKQNSSSAYEYQIELNQISECIHIQIIVRKFCESKRNVSLLLKCD